MRHLFAKLSSLAVLIAISAFAADNTIGTWKLNTEKSKITPSPTAIKTLTMTREAADGGVTVTTIGTRADGQPIKGSYTAKFDGKPYPTTGTPYDTIMLKQVDADTFTTHTKKSDGKYDVMGELKVSKDGKTLTSTTRGKNAEGKALHNHLVYEKQ